MNKERTAVLILEGTITNKQIAKIPKDFQGDIVVNGNIVCTENCEIPGSLWLNGNVEVPYLKVNGDLFCQDGIIIITTSKGIDVLGDFVLKENCHIDTQEINVCGDFEGHGKITSKDINVYDEFRFEGEIDPNGYEIHAGKVAIDAEISQCTGIITS